MAKPELHLAKEASAILAKLEGLKALKASVLEKELRRIWGIGYDHGWRDGHLEGIDVGGDHW